MNATHCNASAFFLYFFLVMNKSKHNGYNHHALFAKQPIVPYHSFFSHFHFFASFPAPLLLRLLLTLLLLFLTYYSHRTPLTSFYPSLSLIIINNPNCIHNATQSKQQSCIYTSRKIVYLFLFLFLSLPASIFLLEQCARLMVMIAILQIEL